MRPCTARRGPTRRRRPGRGGPARWVAAGALAAAAGALPVLPAAPAAAADGRLSWSPPALTDPTTVDVTAARRDLRLEDGRDYVLRLPATPLEHPQGLVVSGGDDVVLIGGEVRVTGSGPTARGLHLRGQTGTVHVEGLRISGAGLAEGIDLDQRRGAVVQLQDVAVETVHGSREGHHADVLQTWAGPDVLRVDRLEGSTTYQGLFLDPTDLHPVPPTAVDLRRVVLRDAGGTSAALLWQSGSFPVTTTDVVVVPRPGLSGLRAPDGLATWRGVARGTAATPSPLAGAPGTGYTSPGYADAAPPAPVTPRPPVGSVPRRQGATRYETAVAVSAASHPSGSPEVVVASGQDHPDALAAGQLAAARGAPLVLVPPSGDLTASVTAELVRLAPRRITLVGGTGAVDDAVLSRLAVLAPTDRVAGADRYATAAAAATTAAAERTRRDGAPGDGAAAGRTVLLASGAGFADALAGGALAARTGDALLLAAPGHLPEPTAAALRALAPARVVLLGGTGALSGAVRDAVAAAVPGAAVERWAGEDRYATAAAIAAHGHPGGAGAAVLALGTDFPDALAGAPAAGAAGIPLLLVRGSCVPAATAGALLALGARDLVVLGGPGAVSAAVEGLAPC